MAASLRYWLALHQLYNWSPQDIASVLNYSEDISLLFSEKNKTLSPRLEEQLKKVNWHKVDKHLKWREAKPNRYIVTIIDEHYPKLLREIACPPLILFVEGDCLCLTQRSIAIVGTRNPTPAGKEMAHDFAKNLAERGFVITSGLATGIDAASHWGALKTGRTIAVMGTGMDEIYPKYHAKLAEAMIQQGALVSDLPLESPPKRDNFPRRNRLISGLSEGVLVIEANIRSGSLITARLAAEQGREVFAIPGSIHNIFTAGCHQLIRNGAKLTEKIEDILEELQPALTRPKKTTLTETPPLSIETLDDPYKKLLSCVGFEQTALDTIAMRSGLSTEEVAVKLLHLELEGYIQSIPGGYYRTVR